MVEKQTYLKLSLLEAKKRTELIQSGVSPSFNLITQVFLCACHSPLGFCCWDR